MLRREEKGRGGTEGEGWEEKLGRGVSLLNAYKIKELNQGCHTRPTLKFPNFP